MIMQIVRSWPLAWNQYATIKFQPRARNLKSSSPWTGGMNVFGPHAQIWYVEATLTPQYDEPVWKAISAFFAEIEGQKGIIRIGDLTRYLPQIDQEREAGREAFSDGTFFSDGTGWATDQLPPQIQAAEPANKGAKSLVVSGLPVSASRVLRRGDHLEIQRNGIQDLTPSLHMVVRDAGTDADGKTRLEIRPPLRKAVATGDTVVIRGATGVFRAVDDMQGQVEVSAPFIGNAGFSLVEAIL